MNIPEASAHTLKGDLFNKRLLQETFITFTHVSYTTLHNIVSFVEKVEV